MSQFAERLQPTKQTISVFKSLILLQIQRSHPKNGLYLFA
ncbi:hypothetical protein PPEP_b0382 [Pseudoalteromonas peptidolytica F12-50-A1]|uniref:Uncharacterized protein n=1 Tax=Pseudoalteromonas peptidolytica F12-50-A1 TaxID=1315280 RepID=A0A8I0N0A7_9GAMM|nr:hypothetical protein [Pseudoalteromonas peptidolytica F12-50-A1]